MGVFEIIGAGTRSKETENLNVFNLIIFNFVVTSRNFIIAKLPIRKPGSSSVLIKSDLLALMKIRAYGSKALR